jgi:hypothetical protein
MGFLRRLLGGGRRENPEPTEPSRKLDDAELDAAEKAYELELLRDDQDRMSDLTRRQLRYAEYAWTPPAQGGERRAEAQDENGDEAENTAGDPE